MPRSKVTKRPGVAWVGLAPSNDLLDSLPGQHSTSIAA